MVSNATWIVFAQLIIFNPQGNGDENELTEFKQKEFSTRSQCYQFLNDNYVYPGYSFKTACGKAKWTSNYFGLWR